MARGNRKAPVFEDDDDRRQFLKLVGEANVRFDVACYAFCLMTNHYHLVLATPRGNLSRAMRHVNGVYTQASNRRHKRTGHLFEGRFRSLIVETEPYLRDLARYVVRNPVRAGLVPDVSSWAWSSYRATAGLAPPPWFLEIDWVDSMFGGNREEAQLKYRLFVNAESRDSQDIESRTLTLATATFDSSLRRVVDADGVPNHLPKAYRALGRPTLGELFGSTSQSRDARNQQIWEAHVRYGYTLAEIGTFLGLHPRTPSMIIRRLGSGLNNQQAPHTGGSDRVDVDC